MALETPYHSQHPRIVLWLGLLFFMALFVLLNHSATFKAFFSRDLGNYEPPSEELFAGPGENGRPHHCPVTSPEVEKSIWKYGMNMICSASISNSRSLPDTRDPECRHSQYPTKLPLASVIIAFHDVGFSALIRHIFSVIKRTPRSVLKEIILIDDASTAKELHLKLDMVTSRFGMMIHLIRNTERRGLLSSRVLGARLATGDVLVFMDANCEVNINWLPPLLTPIFEDSRVITTPIIDTIDKFTFEYRSTYNYDLKLRGIIDWFLKYKELPVFNGDSDHMSNKTFKPFSIPLIKDIIFAIDKERYYQLEGFDTKMNQSEGINFDLSFKAWLCGGRIIAVPCSRIGHVFMEFPNTTKRHYAQQPYNEGLTYRKKIALKWFDKTFLKYFYTLEPTAPYLKVATENNSLTLKRKLHCNSLKWYMKHVLPDMRQYFPPPPENLFWGELRNKATSHCVDNLDLHAPSFMGVRLCESKTDSQLVRLNKMGQMAIGDRCIDGDAKGIIQIPCIPGTVNGPWRFVKSDQVLLHMMTLKCLGLHLFTKQLRLFQCFRRDRFQQWEFYNKHNWI